MEDIVIVSAARTAVGKFGGSLGSIPAVTFMPHGSVVGLPYVPSPENQHPARPIA